MFIRRASFKSANAVALLKKEPSQTQREPSQSLEEEEEEEEEEEVGR